MKILLFICENLNLKRPFYVIFFAKRQLYNIKWFNAEGELAGGGAGGGKERGGNKGGEGVGEAGGRGGGVGKAEEGGGGGKVGEGRGGKVGGEGGELAKMRNPPSFPSYCSLSTAERII